MNLTTLNKIAFGEKWVDELVAIIKKSLASLLPKTNYTIEIENRGEVDLQIIVHGSGFSIDLDETERKSIKGTVIVPAWQLTGYTIHPATHMDPEEVEDAPLSVHTSHWHAAAALINAIFADEVNGWFDSEGEAAAYNSDSDHIGFIATDFGRKTDA